MKTRSVVLTLAAMFIGMNLCSAQSWTIGSWKLNESNSKILPGNAKLVAVVYEAAGDRIKCTIDGLDPQGKPLHEEWTGKFDGEYYPLTGDSKGDMRAYKKVNEREIQEITVKNSTVVRTSRIVVFNDGKSSSVITALTDRDGDKAYNVEVYDKQ
jgi:hypothetical protein